MFAVYTYLRSLIAGRVAEDRGATAAEYGLLLAFIALAIIIGVTAVGTNLNAFFQGLADDIANW